MSRFSAATFASCSPTKVFDAVNCCTSTPSLTFAFPVYVLAPVRASCPCTDFSVPPFIAHCCCTSEYFPSQFRFAFARVSSLTFVSAMMLFSVISSSTPLRAFSTSRATAITSAMLPSLFVKVRSSGSHTLQNVCSTVIPISSAS